MPLTPRALQRLAREATVQPYAQAARALREDWRVGLDGKQVQRWADQLGAAVLAAGAAELLASECGRPPEGPPNPPELLVIEADGGRVQMRAADPESGSRWREDKVGTVTSYTPGDGQERPPQPVVKTHVASLADAREFGRRLRLEAERRGLHRAGQVLLLGDGAVWIDTTQQEEFPQAVRIVDWIHALEHLNACAKALYGEGTRAAAAWAERWEARLWEGEVEAVEAALLRELRRRGGPPGQEAPPDDPRRIVARELGYFSARRSQMRYGEFRRRGWPISSGDVEAGVKQFNKRVKGTEQFWSEAGVEAILALRALWLSQDERWERYWRTRPAYPVSEVA